MSEAGPGGTSEKEPSEEGADWTDKVTQGAMVDRDNMCRRERLEGFFGERVGYEVVGDMKRSSRKSSMRGMLNR